MIKSNLNITLIFLLIILNLTHNSECKLKEISVKKEIRRKASCLQRHLFLTQAFSDDNLRMAKRNSDFYFYSEKDFYKMKLLYTFKNVNINCIV
ncbi:hypothetical protein GCL60_05500 [Silvanigrella paludirubra]|uniref:Uncharacterized protein n=1 Tax=Silvanigrella paludirubra TaxID=2499159 RepID=A0A6N6VWA8_9BACT|nr:hypothetical protein [Silvanigrella paludirubra]KAB8039717.1 hypothetical protein GCL60_05500 [Silvanigrella paludirubra]